MRMRAKVRGPQDALGKFGLVIRALRIVPESAVAVMELWVLSSHTTWQFFRIMPDRIVEIRCDGTLVAGSGQNAVDKTATSPDPAGVLDLDCFHPQVSSLGSTITDL